MSLLKWKELAKRKTESGNKINYIYDLIKQKGIDKKTSNESFSKVFEPITSKLDDVIDSNLNLRMPQMRKRPPKKVDPGIDYMPEVDPYEDMDVEGLIDYGDYVPPQQEKQMVPKPPTYEESLKDLMEGKKELYVDPQYFPQEPYDMPPEYDEEDEIDYTMDDEDINNEILTDIGIKNYEDVELILKQQQMTPQKTKAYLTKIIKEAEYKKKQLNGFKANVTKKLKSGKISEAERQEKNKRIDDARVVLKEYTNHYKTKLKTIKGSGIKGRGRKQRGGNVMFFNDVKQLLKKLEGIIGERLAGNTSIKVRNMGVNILDTLLKMSTINKPQYNKIYNNYFKI